MTVDPAPADAPPTDASPDAAFVQVIRDEIVRQSIDAIIITDLAYRVRGWNPAAERLYGIPDVEAIGRRLSDLVHSREVDGRELDAAAARNTLERTGAWRQRLVHQPLRGSRIDEPMAIDSVVTTLRDASGEAIAILGVNRDITATARVESEMAALGSIVLATGHPGNSAHVAQTALDILCRATGAEAGLVTSTEGAYEAIGASGLDPATIEVIVSYGQLGGPLALALKPEDAWISADVATAPIREDVRAAVLADGIRHLVIVGLRLSGRLIGIVALGWRHEKPIEPSRSILLQAAAAIASSLENARLLTAVESGLESERLLTRRMRALVELTRLPEATGVVRGDWDRFVADVGAVLGADATAFGRSDGERITLAGSDGLDGDWASQMMDRRVADVPMAAQLAAGSNAFVVAIDSDEVTEMARAALSSLGFRSLAAFAIRDDGRLVGLVFAMFRKNREDLEIDDRTLDAIGRVLDISFANRRLREGVLASENRYRELFESSPDALLVQTVDEVVVDANPAAVRLYGSGLIGQRVDELVAHPPGPSGAGTLSPHGYTQYTGVGRRLDGTTFPEEVDLRPIEIDGEPRLLVIVRDLTERSRLQGELIQAQKMEAIGLLVAGVAHELNNPLASIVAFSQLLRTDPDLPADLRRQADMLVQEANRTRSIVQNLLDFARQRPPERAETQLRPLIESVLGLQSYILARNRLRVEIDIPADLPLLLLDRSQMQQVLINLTVNAAQAIAELGRPGLIRIEARALSTDTGVVVRITVADDGPGVADSMRDRLFVPFVTTKQPGEGTGLGLSVSFGIVAGHGGTLRHEPNPGGGAVFVMELPVGKLQPDDGAADDGAADTETARPRAPDAQAVATGPAGTSGPRPATPPPTPTPWAVAPPTPVRAEAVSPSPATTVRDDGRPNRVLVLDDEPSIREFLGRVLERSGYESILSSTGRAALEIVAADPPDAILCDHRMAGMSGTEFHTAVAKISPGLSRRFAFMSGDVLNPELLDFATAHGVHVLAKPFDIATIGAMVGRLLAVAEGPAAVDGSAAVAPPRTGDQLGG